MRGAELLMFLSMTGLLIGCTSRSLGGRSTNVVFVVPGVSGDGAHYDGLIRALRDSQNDSIQVVRWGAPKPFFFMNFSTKSIHDHAEDSLARRISEWRRVHPTAQISLIGHSAGCGVILGALPRLPDDARIENVILLAPSVSPSYNLAPSLRHLAGKMQVFISHRDTLFLKWRTGNFGTYDGVRVAAAGCLGFDLTMLVSHSREKVVQHDYNPRWKSLGNRGGHFGSLREPFVRKILIPLIRKTQSSEGNSP